MTVVTMLNGIALGAVGMVVLTWLGYPGAVWVRTRLRRDPLRPAPIGAEPPRVSVILATRSTASGISARVANLLDTDYPAERLEVVVARDVGGVTSDTPPPLLPDARVLAVDGDAPGGKAATLNAAVRVATGEILVLADVAQRFERGTIPALVSALADPRFGAVSGALMLGPTTHAGSPMRAYWAMEKALRAHEADWHSSIGVTGAVYAIRRVLWPEVPAGTILDDVYVPMTVVLRGARVGFVPGARAIDMRLVAPDVEQARKTRTLTGNLQLVHLLPTLLTRENPVRAQFLWHKLARLLTPLWLALAVLAGVPALVRTVASWPATAWLAIGVVCGGIVVIAPLRRRVVGAIRWGLVLQWATLRALGNATRGRWNVWDTP